MMQISKINFTLEGEVSNYFNFLKKFEIRTERSTRNKPTQLSGFYYFYDMSIKKYINSLSSEKKDTVKKIISVIQRKLPKGFNEQINYGMPSWVVPHSTYPKGYHCSPELPLPFLSLASRKNYIALYHMGIYANKELMEWFVEEYPKHSKYKLDIGKSCIRFKRLDDIPFNLIGELCSKMSVKDWITIYEKEINP